MVNMFISSFSLLFPVSLSGGVAGVLFIIILYRMIIVSKELFQNREVFYKKELDGAGQVLSSIRYDCRTFKMEVDGRTVVMMLDRNGWIRKDPYIYVNDLRVGKPIGTRVQMATALQLFYTFCDIYSFDPRCLSGLAVERLIRFMTCLDLESEDGSILKMPSVETVKGYLALIRKFIRKMGFIEKGFEDSDSVKHIIATPGGRQESIIVSAYSLNREMLKSDPFKRFRLPKHFTPTQAQEVVRRMREKRDDMMLLIFMLGFGEGLRRGEILGLTREDFVTETDAETGEVLYYIILRNRVSDGPDQHAKTLMHPTRIDQYYNKLFRKSWQKIEIRKSLYDRAVGFYEKSRNVDKLGVNRYKAIQEATKADSWDGIKVDNHYIFFSCYNGRYQCLSGNTLNNRLGSYFKACGLHLGNVSHAMRHSFAMYHAHYAPVKMELEQLQNLMRHASPSSTAVYYNLTDEEKRQLRSIYNQELANLIPEFK